MAGEKAIFVTQMAAQPSRELWLGILCRDKTNASVRLETKNILRMVKSI